MLDFLDEDLPFDDISSKLIPEHTICKARIEARENFKVFGLYYSKVLLDYLGIRAELNKRDGDWVVKGDILVHITGDARKILSVERTVLNVISHLSGITTQVAFFVMKAKAINPEVKIACTRKTTPGLRYFEKMAFEAGGGDTHRFSLSDQVMLKDNHLRILGGIESALKAATSASSFAHKIEMEVETFEDAMKAAEMGASIVMLDNMNPEEVSKVVAAYKSRGYYGSVILEASGGIDFDNVEEYAKTGVNVISAGILTKTVRSCDVSLEVEL